jgi:hypothetical protein
MVVSFGFTGCSVLLRAAIVPKSLVKCPLFLVEGLFRDSDPSQQICQRYSRFGLLQERHNLFHAEQLLFHGKISSFSGLGSACLTSTEMWKQHDHVVRVIGGVRTGLTTAVRKRSKTTMNPGRRNVRALLGV